ncbi:MAG: helix-turn-helix domain-containing protein [Pirellulaceae bacterium]
MTTIDTVPTVAAPVAAPVPKLVTVAAVAEAAGVSVITVHRWIDQGILPQPIRFGRRTLRFRADEIDHCFNP